MTWAVLLLDGHFSDVVLCVGDRKFPVHRAILAARSPVFRAMFTSNMKESVAEEIQIEEIKPDVMEEILRCVYTDQVPVECGCDVLIAFDRFGWISLFDRCQDSVTITVRECAFEVFRCCGRIERQTSEDEDTQVPEESWGAHATQNKLNQQLRKIWRFKPEESVSHNWCNTLATTQQFMRKSILNVLNFLLYFCVFIFQIYCILNGLIIFFSTSFLIRWLGRFE